MEKSAGEDGRPAANGEKGAASLLVVRVPVSGWEDAGAFTVYNPASDASPSREAPMPGSERKGSW